MTEITLTKCAGMLLPNKDSQAYVDAMDKEITFVPMTHVKALVTSAFLAGQFKGGDPVFKEARAYCDEVLGG